MKTNYVKFNILAESKKVLSGKPTKVDRGSLLHALADMLVVESSRAKR
jgi:hypothetical protein